MILCEKASFMEFCYRKGSVVGRILGTTCEKHQGTFEGDPREIYSQF